MGTLSWMIPAGPILSRILKVQEEGTMWMRDDGVSSRGSEQGDVSALEASTFCTGFSCCHYTTWVR